MRIRRTREPEVIVVQDGERARSTESRKRSVESTWSSREVPWGRRGIQEREVSEDIQSWSQRVGVVLEESELRREDGPDHPESH